jgi:PadR family transcriptional regulator, regulatory protein PadR
MRQAGFATGCAAYEWAQKVIHAHRSSQIRRFHLTFKYNTSLLGCQVKKMTLPILQGTLDLMILRTLATMGPQHAYGIASRLEQVSGDQLDLNQGTIYPALVRLEQHGWTRGSWGKTENNREAKYYTITRAGMRALDQETIRWRQMAGVVEKLLTEEQ